MAPRLIRLPLMPRARIPMNALSMQSGIIAAATRPARRLRSIRKSTTTTSSPPSTRLRETVLSVRSTSVVRS